ncbi:MAG: glycoside hydrolase family 16 protein [Brevundimonas sp.]|nr:MAG: glycoside hydrolase family 16 protein [Brevundimonas sp.]
MLGLMLAAALAGEAATTPPVAGLPEGYRLVWADEFETAGAPDPSKWGYDTVANRTGWYNEELQYYSANRLENAEVRDGKLVITARRERLESAPDFGGQDYTSARLVTRDLHSWTYGFISVRANLPCGLGSWPAIWMLSQGGGWPIGGEIDIMEHVAQEPTKIYGSLHSQAFNHSIGTGQTGGTDIATACGAFHDYQVHWTPQRIDFLVDGTPFYGVDNDNSGLREHWPFNTPFYLILNVAVGGTWGGAEGVDPSVFPQAMEVDYVRVYQTAE